MQTHVRVRLTVALFSSVGTCIAGEIKLN